MATAMRLEKEDKLRIIAIQRSWYHLLMHASAPKPFPKRHYPNPNKEKPKNKPIHED
jgi:hypothetical protein